MAVEKINIKTFLELSLQNPVIDVRSPGEYNHAHFPSAFSLPLFSDEERKIVGTAYKQQSREAAIKVGLDFFGVKMKGMVEEVEKIVDSCQLTVASENTPSVNSQLTTTNSVLIYCWRGGMRSAGVAWLLDLYGFKVYTLVGGYKTFRRWALNEFQNEYDLKILGGYTGSGKTDLVREMQKDGVPVLDLEKIANHKGSAFGALGEEAQPSQEMFENLLALNIYRITNSPANKSSANGTGATWVEDESQRIGKLIIPELFWKQMRNSPVSFLDIPFEERLKYLVENYGRHDKTKLGEAILRIQKRLGGLETKNALALLSEDNVTECFRILLNYYDRLYRKGLQNRKNYESLLNIIPCESVKVENLTNVLQLQV